MAVGLSSHQRDISVLRVGSGCDLNAGYGVGSRALIGINVIQRHAFLSVLLNFGIRCRDNPVSQFRLFPMRFARFLSADELGNLGPYGLDVAKRRLENAARRARAPEDFVHKSFDWQ